MRNLIDLSGKKIMITGASSGIGREIAILASQLGSQVFLVGRNNDKLEDTMSRLEGVNHDYISYDLNKLDEIEKIFEKGIGYNQKKFDGLVYSAGISKVIPLNSISYKNMNEIMNINFYSFIMMVKLFSKKKYSCSGSIVSLSSTAAIIPERCQTIYASSKAALNSATSTLAIELNEKKIRINTIIAGYTDTPMTRVVIDEMSLEHHNKLAQRQLLGICQPEDIANMAMFLLSDASKAITGRNVFVDGGRFL